MMTKTLEYDYDNQAWIKDGKYVSCNHPESMKCSCYGKLHEGEDANLLKEILLQITCPICHEPLIDGDNYKCEICGWYPELDDEMIENEEFNRTQV